MNTYCMYLNNDEKIFFEIVSFSFRWNDFSIENQLDKKISKNIEDSIIETTIFPSEKQHNFIIDVTTNLKVFPHREYQ